MRGDIKAGRKELALIRGEEKDRGETTHPERKKYWTDKISLARLVTEVATDHIFEALKEKHGEDGAIKMCNVEPIVREEDAEEMSPETNPYIAYGRGTSSRGPIMDVGVKLMHPDMDAADALTFAREVQQARFLFSLLASSFQSGREREKLVISETELARYARLAAFDPVKIRRDEESTRSDRIRLDGNSADYCVEIPETDRTGDICSMLQKLAKSRGGFNGKDQLFMLMRVLGNDMNLLNRYNRNHFFQDTVGVNVNATGGLLTVRGQPATPEHIQEFDGYRDRYSELKRQVGDAGLAKPQDIASIREAREFVEDLVAQAAQREIDLKKGHEERERELREQQQREKEYLEQQLRAARAEAAREKERADSEKKSKDDAKRHGTEAVGRANGLQIELEHAQAGIRARDGAVEILRAKYGSGGLGSGKHVKAFLNEGPDGDERESYRASIRAAKAKERGA